jgi:ribosome-binding ATPase YchF (GTP1/OBG family)
MSLEVGIIGLPGAGKSTLFAALTGAAPESYGTAHVGMAPVPDERLAQVAAVVGSPKATPAAIRVLDLPGTTAAQLGGARAADALVAVVKDEADVESLQLELIVADRDHVERRLEKVRKDAKSGDPQLKQEVEELERLLAHVEAGRSLGEYDRELPPALQQLVQRLHESLDLVTFFTANENEARAWQLRRGSTALDAAATIHTDMARGFIRCEVVRWSDLVEAGSRAEVSRRGLQRLEGKGYVVEDGDVLTIRFNV